MFYLPTTIKTLSLELTYICNADASAHPELSLLDQLFLNHFECFW